MQAIPGDIKTSVILISSQMTDKNGIQPTYRLTTCFIVMSSSIPEQGIHDEFATAFNVLSK